MNIFVFILQASLNDFSEDISISISSCVDTYTDDSTSPNRPPRRKRCTPQTPPGRNNQGTPPPRPPKTFVGEFPGLRPKSTIPRPSSTSPRTVSDDNMRSMTLPVKSKDQQFCYNQEKSPALSTSTPSSPEPTSARKLPPKLPDKSRKSWPFLFCECLNSGYDSGNNAGK